MARKKRGYGTGSIIKKPNGTFEGRYVVGYKENGYAITKSVFAKTRPECEKKLEEAKAKDGKVTARDINPEITFGEWVDFWFQTYALPHIREATKIGYSGNIQRHIKPQLGHIKLNKLTENDLQQFYTHLKKEGRLTKTELYGPGLSNQMVRSCHLICRQALEKAKDMHLITKNPAIGRKLPPKKAQEMQVLTPEEMQRFLIQAQYEGYYEMFLLELCTGMRRGELLALEWRDLNFKTGELRIDKQVSTVDHKLVCTKPKTKESMRTVVLSPSVLEVLKEYKKSVDSKLMFPSPAKGKDEYRNPCSVASKLRDILDRAGCKRVRFHDLRHTFATMALENGMDIKTLSAVIGHKSSATTLDIYAHTTDGMQRQAASNIERRIAGNETDADDTGESAKDEITMTDFEPTKFSVRRPGTGCITQINDHLFEGRYSPMWVNGKKRSINVYAKTREECEEKLAAMIIEVKAEKERLLAEKAAQEQAEKEVADAKPKKRQSKKK